MQDKQALLHKYWHYDGFRPGQEAIIDSVLQGHDTLALMPTGGGKSLCYQLPALLLDGVCLVVSPLIALMKDQVEQLRQRHLKAACIVSGASAQENMAALYNAMAGEVKYLYVSPERLQQRQFIEHLRRMKLCLIAVDEAHCISQWGYDFRPPYLHIADIRAYHPQTPVIALTATATPVVADDICAKLNMMHSRRFCNSFYRENLAYKVFHTADKSSHLLRLAAGNEGSMVVYVRNRRRTQHYATLLQEAGITATFYHAGLDAAERDRRQALWMHGNCRVIVATTAFGMGIDKADVRMVVHMDIPDSIEAYFQEAGRAGRDGLPAEAIMLCEETDRERLLYDFEADFPPVRFIRNVYRAICNNYSIPMGSGLNAQFDFDLQKLCENYRFQPRDFYSACRFLEREGLIMLPERDQAYSQLYIPLERDQLYRFQVDHQALGTLLQVVMRLYPGLFSAPTPIDEKQVGQRCFLEPQEVAERLKQLHAMRVVDYRPRPTMPQIFFTSPRIDDKDIYLGEENYGHLRQAAAERLEAMRQYIDNNSHCRSRQLLAYFGEEQTADCGRCDVCQGREHKQHSIEAAITETIRKNRIDVSGLCGIMAAQGFGDIMPTLRQMMDRGAVRLDANLLLSIS